MNLNIINYILSLNNIINIFYKKVIFPQKLLNPDKTSNYTFFLNCCLNNTSNF